MHDRLEDVDGRRPVVFVGPSLAPQQVRAELPEAVVLPPVKRDDLYVVRERGTRSLLVVDGVFAQHLALSPREVVDVLEDGATVVGAASLGAVRAAECWPAGMVGVGLIFRLFKIGVLRDDDEVAVSVLPARGYAAGSISLVNARYALTRARRAGIVTRAIAGELVERCANTYFTERAWDSLLHDLPHSVDGRALRTLCEQTDLKRDDARTAVSHMRTILERERPPALVRARVVTGSLRPPPRYPGHHQLLGLSQRELGEGLVRWLLGSGRYSRHPGSIAQAARELTGAYPDEVPDRFDQADCSALAATLARLMQGDGFDERVHDVAAVVCEALARRGELDAELLRWHAVTTLAEAASDAGCVAGDDMLTHVQERVAVLHGFPTWHALLGAIEHDTLPGGITFGWIERACEAVALALTTPQTGVTLRSVSEPSPPDS
jgi:hypothetical protein